MSFIRKRLGDLVDIFATGFENYLEVFFLRKILDGLVNNLP